MDDAATMTVTFGKRSVPETVATLVAALSRRHIEVFARINHAKGAHNAGIDLPANQVLIFGDPSVGTALLQDDPRIGIELPLRILVWEQDGTTRVGYRSPRQLAAIYDVSRRAGVLDCMEKLLDEVVGEAVGEAAA